MLPTPGFHHLHLNSVDPESAIGFYTRQFPTTAKTSGVKLQRSAATAPAIAINKIGTVIAGK